MVERARPWVIGLDPGTRSGAYMILDTRKAPGRVVAHGHVPNTALAESGWWRRLLQEHTGPAPGVILAQEQMRSYGMAVGDDVFSTVWWAGRAAQAWREVTAFGEIHLVPRKSVVMALCHTPRAADKNVRWALINRFSAGVGRRAAMGTKKAPGPLYGVKKHTWAALAVAVYAMDEILPAQAEEPFFLG